MSDRYEERHFTDGFNAVQDWRQGLSSQDARTHGVSLTEEQCRDLASQPKLTVADWTDLTGVGRGLFRMYQVSAECVEFRRWSDHEIRQYPSADQVDMERENASPALSFPCSPDELVTFVDQACIGGRNFDVPVAFRAAASQLRNTESDARAILADDTIPQKPALTVMKKKVVIEMLSRRYPMLENDLKRSEPWTKECKVDGRSGYYYLEMLEQGCITKWGGAPSNREISADSLSMIGQLNFLRS
ncbi:MAG: hypothetical protein LCH90_02405 [Proteobacteria bacterium]|nr:hypothetical protein [Pseudomonadota bacterium]